MQYSTSDFPSEEFRLIEGLKKFCNSSSNKRFTLGVGDDAAVRLGDASEQCILTADTMVEDVHFSLSYMDLAEVGYKAMAANVSDCAAMGAVPDSALIQLLWPNSCRDNAKDIGLLYEGFNRACRRWDFPIVGGNLSRGPCWIIAITLLGRKDAGQRVLTRTGAVDGDKVWISGIAGKSAAGLAALSQFGRQEGEKQFNDLIICHIAPEPDVELGLVLAQDPSVHAVIDLSDGIAKECHTLCFENKVGISLNPDENCLTDLMSILSQSLHIPWYEWFLYGGEDYKLLFTASDTFNASKYIGNELYCIGAVTDRTNGVKFRDFDGTVHNVEKRAWDHCRV